MNLNDLFIRGKLKRKLNKEYNDSEDILDIFDEFDLKKDVHSLYECCKYIEVIYNGEGVRLTNFLALEEYIYGSEKLSYEEMKEDILGLKQQEFDKTFVYDVLVKEYLIPCLNDKDRPRYVLDDFLYNFMIMLADGEETDIDKFMDALIKNESDELIEKVLVFYFSSRALNNIKTHRFIKYSMHYFILNGKYERIGNILSKSFFEYTEEEYLSDYENTFNHHNNYRLCAYYFFHGNEEDNMTNDDELIKRYYEFFAGFHMIKTEKNKLKSDGFINTYLLTMLIEEVNNSNNVIAKCCVLECCYRYMDTKMKCNLMKSVFESDDKELVEWIYYMGLVIGEEKEVKDLLESYRSSETCILEKSIKLELK